MSDQGVDYPVQVRRHVWDSLVSMVRVYAHAASLNAGDEYGVTETPGEASVTHREAALNLRFSPETGEGCWRILQPEREQFGEFRIEADGTLHFPAGSRPLDAAAIEWIEQLAHAEASGPWQIHREPGQHIVSSTLAKWRDLRFFYLKIKS